VIPSVAVATSGERFRVVYRMPGTIEEARQRAREIAVEQTVEIPEDLIPAGDIADVVVGRLEALEPAPEGGHLATISYAVESAGGELTQLLNVVFGNSSLKPPLRVEGLDLPNLLLATFRGPRFGQEGLRALVGAADRPLFCSAIKPLGLPAAELAKQAYEFRLGGIDVVKDDHGLADQAWAPFEERVGRCVEAVDRANRETDRTVLYAPNVTAPGVRLVERARRAKALGAGALLVAPGLVGFGAMQQLADDDAIGLPILSHPALLGSFLSAFAVGVLFGQMVRLAGADATIYANHGGRFPVTSDDCRAIARASAAPLGSMKPILPTPGGGMTLDRIAEMREMYGADVMYLVGGGLHRPGASIVENCRKLVALALDRA
jgi:ribulose-bisphosphate carboxylase large chain